MPVTGPGKKMRSTVCLFFLLALPSPLSHFLPQASARHPRPPWPPAAPSRRLPWFCPSHRRMAKGLTLLPFEFLPLLVLSFPRTQKIQRVWGEQKARKIQLVWHDSKGLKIHPRFLVPMVWIKKTKFLVPGWVLGKLGPARNKVP
jgi:hypothetical protein